MFEEEYFKERNPELEPKHEFEVRKWVQYFSLQPGDKIFECGTGYGQRLHWFLVLGMNAWGMDISRYAREHSYGESKGRVSNYIPSGKDSKDWYDLVISVDVLEHLDDQLLVDVIIKLRALALKAIYGITYIDNHNFPKDPTHINGKTKQEWKEFLGKYYDRVYDAPADWYESDMYLICYRRKK